MPDAPHSEPDLDTTQSFTGAQVRSGLAWSLANSLVLRVGTFLVGVALARLLTPGEFGAYAVALTVQTILMTVADLGLSADLIRSDQPRRRAPTVATLGLVTSVGLAVLCAALASPLAHAMGSPDATTAIAVLSVTLVLGGVGIVPFAHLQRELAQRALFVTALLDLVVSTVVTLVLVTRGHGVVSLAIGRVAGQGVSVVCQFAITRMLPSFAWNRDVARSVLRFGVPVAGTNLLSWVLLSVDYVIVARLVGPVALGFYVLAFNVSTWPMTAIGQVVRSVALPAFARSSPADAVRALGHALAITSGLAVLAGITLAGLAGPLVEVVYGAKWAPAAPILTALAIFGTCRVVFDLLASYLLARGLSRPVLMLQVLWAIVLIPTLILATIGWGTVGAGWAHMGVAAGFVLPAYVVAVHAGGVPYRRVLTALVPPLLTAVPLVVVALVISHFVGNSWLGLVVGGTATTLTFVVILGPWLRRHVEALRSGARPVSLPAATTAGLAGGAA